MESLNSNINVKSNCDILLSALKDYGGVATRDQLVRFVWESQNVEKYRRHGKAWSALKAEHDMHYLVKDGRVLMVESPRNHFTYYLSEKELWV